MASRRRRGLFARIWGAGLLQAIATDAVIAVGLLLIGVGLWQIAPAAVWVYAGLVLVTVGMLLAASAAREPQTRGPRSEP